MKYQKSKDSIDNWQTPPWLFDLLNTIFKFTVDGAADETNHLLPRYYTDYFIQSPQAKNENIFVNPPFSQLKTGDWNLWSKINASANNNLVVILQPFRPETRYWHEWIWGKANVFIFNKRIQYVNPISKRVQQGVPMPSVLLIYGDDSCIDYSPLYKFGVLIKKEGTSNGKIS